MSFEVVPKALEEIRAGRMVILVDDEDRENEGDLCLAAEKVTPEAINFMAKYGRGLICLALNEARLKQLELPMMVDQNNSQFGTAFTVSVEARRGVTTGISAADRAVTVRTAVAADAKPSDLVRPGHIFPLRAQPGGVLVRTGQTEGAVDLARLAGLEPAGVICEVMKDDGTMARMKDLEVFADEHRLMILSIADLIEYRMRNESLVTCLVSRAVNHPTFGAIEVRAYGTSVDGRQHLAMVRGDPKSVESPLVRVHAGYPLSDVFGDLFSRDRQTLRAAIGRLRDEPCGVILCLDPGARNIPLDERLRKLGDGPPSREYEAGGILREIGIGAQILRDLGLSRVRILSNNPKRLAGIEGFGLVVDEVIPLDVASTLHVITGNNE
jgi:3,4-dihydroxy 2-butanone 4-phosphate synthase/GTP cyclohydrolase II